MNYLHSGELGDVIYSLPSIKSIQQLRCPRFTRGNLYLKAEVAGPIPAWAGTRQPVRLTRDQVEKLLPLLKSQPGFAEVALFEGQPIDIDLDRFRQLSALNLATGHIGRFYSYAFKCKPLLYLPWLEVKPSDRFKGCILVNRTLRYRNPKIDYSFLAGKPNVVFMGLANEFAEFNKDCPRLPHVTAGNYLELAEWIAGAKGFIGNQSFCWTLAEALKVPRLLEVFPQAPIACPMGPKGWDAISPELFAEIGQDLLSSC